MSIISFTILIIAFLAGVLITTYILFTSVFRKKISAILKIEEDKYSQLDKDFSIYKAHNESKIESSLTNENRLNNQIAILTEKIEEKNTEFLSLKELIAQNNAEEVSSKNQLLTTTNELVELKKLFNDLRSERDQIHQKHSETLALKNNLEEKLQNQLGEIENLNKKFTTEFENVANKIFENKSQKFTEINKESLKGILDPLGRNIDDFKKQVNDAYKNESNERFSLSERVKELTDLNKTITEETRNLTKALKGEAKTQGRWGEMILEKILEKSGLRKGDEYFMEYQLFDTEGKALRSESEGKKMRPDALIMYPDNRHVIIDSKVSLNAFVRFIESEDIDQQKNELDSHIIAIKSHIDDLSKKAYDDYEKTLDFVMMFIPNEPAYISAMQGDSNLWNYAYEKRILLISPTNLITSLKLIVDLWKREYQNRNANAIAERGAKMFDKFVGFVENLEVVGNHINKAQEKYNETFKQLTSGNDNLISQATKLKALGVKNKKELKEGTAEIGSQNDLDD